MEIGDSCSAIPPLILRCGFGRTFFFAIITCSTRTLPSSGNTRSTRPSFPLSRPVITFTWSLRLMSTLFCMFSLQTRLLQHFRCKRNDLQKFLLAQFARHRAENASSHGFARLIDQHSSVLVKTNVGPVAATMFLALAHNYAFDHGAFFR